MIVDMVLQGLDLSIHAPERKVNKRNKIHYRCDETDEYGTWLSSWVACEENSENWRYGNTDGSARKLRTTKSWGEVTCKHCLKKKGWKE